MKHQDTAIEIKIGKLWNSAEGTTEKFHIDQPIKFATEEIKPLSNLDCDILLIKLKDEITVILSDFSITLGVKCERCLKDIEFKLNIDSIERHFRVKLEKNDTDPFESFLIDKQKMSIDLSDMIRQEIILHFPLISLCSKSCKGLCGKCGVNLNKTTCKCAPEEDLNKQQPFKNIKTILKAKNKVGKSKKR